MVHWILLKFLQVKRAGSIYLNTTERKGGRKSKRGKEIDRRTTTKREKEKDREIYKVVHDCCNAHLILVVAPPHS